MQWNWQQKDWPHFWYDKVPLEKLEAQFLHQAGTTFGAYQHINDQDKALLRVDLMSDEALKTSEIEGEYLNRESLQSSIRRDFGLESDKRKISPAEQGIAAMMLDLYHHYSEPLIRDTLFKWHKMVTKGRRDLEGIGCYRTHKEPMQIISGSTYNPKIHFVV